MSHQQKSYSNQSHLHSGFREKRNRDGYRGGSNHSGLNHSGSNQSAPSPARSNYPNMNNNANNYPTQTNSSTSTIQTNQQNDQQPENTEPEILTTQDLEVFNSFDDMGLTDELLRGIFSYGFEKPSVIQQKAIVPFKTGRDMIAQSQSGTGKTGAFSIGCLARVNLNDPETQAIVISPTRELAEQTNKVFHELGSLTGARMCLLVGGTSVNEDIDNISGQRPHVVIGTPGRIYDMILRKVLHTNSIRMLILDEADEMLSYGFKDQIYNIFTQLPGDIQVGLFSATLPIDVLELSKKFMRDPIRILVKKDQLTLEGIRQFYIELHREDWKFDTLLDLYKTLTLAQTIIYVTTRNKCEWLERKLQEKAYSVSATHGSMSAEQRKQILDNFRRGDSRILISTDLLARGIDVQQVSLVINYDLPNNIENYIHRIGGLVVLDVKVLQLILQPMKILSG